MRDHDRYSIRTVIWHASGEWLANDYPVIYNKEGAQGFASGVTYARRYGLSLVLGLAAEDDDDGNTADGNTIVQPPRPQQQPQTRVATRRPKPPADNVMVDPNTGEVDEKPAKQLDEDYLHHDGMLMAAAQGRGGLPATQKLREAWMAMHPDMQRRLQPNLAAYKSIAAQVDIGYQQANRESV